MLRNSVTIESLVLNMFHSVHWGLVFSLCVGWIELSSSLAGERWMSSLCAVANLAKNRFPFLCMIIYIPVQPLYWQNTYTTWAKVNACSLLHSSTSQDHLLVKIVVDLSRKCCWPSCYKIYDIKNVITYITCPKIVKFQKFSSVICDHMTQVWLMIN